MKISNILPLAFIFPLALFAQEPTEATTEEEYVEPISTFSSTRVVNGHSVETLSKGTYEFRIEHRFGDLAGVNGGVQQMFGFDNLSDMRIALEYGITDQLMVGFGRSKGTGAPYRSLVDGFIKYKVIAQEPKKSPISITAVAGSSFTYMTASQDEGLVTHFPKAVHRLNYFAQVNFAHHFGDRGALQLSPTLVHRNYVANTDANDLWLRYGETATTGSGGWTYKIGSGVTWEMPAALYGGRIDGIWTAAGAGVAEITEY